MSDIYALLGIVGFVAAMFALMWTMERA